MENIGNTANAQAQQTLRRMFSQPQADPTEVIKLWREAADHAVKRSDRTGLALLNGLVERAAWPATPLLNIYHKYYQGRLAEIERELVQASEIYREGLALIEALPEDERGSLVPMFQVRLALTLLNRSQTEQAQMLIDNLTGPDEEWFKMQEYHARSNLNYYLGNLEKSTTLAEQALPLARSQNDIDLVATLTNNMAIFAIASGKWNLGQQLATETIRLRQQANLQRKLGAAYGTLADIYIHMQQYEQAVDTYKTAITLVRTLKLTDSVATFQSNLAHIYYVMGRPVEGLEAAQQAIIIQRELDRLGHLIGALAIAALNAQQLGQSVQAKTYLAEALELVERNETQLEATYNLAESYAYIADAIQAVLPSEIDRGRAEYYYQQSLDNYEKVKNNSEALNVLLRLSEMFGPSAKSAEVYARWQRIRPGVSDEDLQLQYDRLFDFARRLSQSALVPASLAVYRDLFQLPTSATPAARQKLARYYEEVANLTGPDEAISYLEQALNLLKETNTPVNDQKTLRARLDNLKKQAKRR